jgi:formate/nitrite transporter FocA (FNT family)
MDYVKPTEVAKNMIEAAAAKAALSVSDFLIRGFLSGALLGFATTLGRAPVLKESCPLSGRARAKGMLVAILAVPS